MRTAHLFAQATSLTLHVLIGLWIVWLASPVWQPVPTGQASDAMGVFVVPADEPPPLPQLPGLNPIDTSQDDVTIRRPDGSSALSLPGFTYDFSRIARRATLLFPFLTPGLSLDRFVPTPRREIINSFHDSSAPMPVNSRSAGRDKPPLTLSDAALQSVIDECWSRTDRWGGFQRLVKLADTYNPDVGRLSAVLQRYLEQDGLQPYVDTTIRDPRLPAYFCKNLLGGYGGQDFNTPQPNNTVSTFQCKPLRFGDTYRMPYVSYFENELILAEAYSATGDDGSALIHLNNERRLYVNTVYPPTAGPPATAALPLLSGITGPALFDSIMVEKYVAMFQNMETVNDYRRTCIPAVTVVINTAGFKNVPGRLFYPRSERNVNSNIPDPSAQLGVSGHYFRNQGDVTACTVQTAP